jgi:O-antigen/teichoic acid export membrane protein
MATDAIEPQRKQGNFIGRSLATASSRLLDLPTRYGMHFLIAARLPIAQLGRFYIAFSVMTLLSGFGRNGMDRALTKEVAAAMGRDLPEVARKAIRRTFLVVIAQSVGLGALACLVSHIVAVREFHDATLAFPLMLASLSIIPQNIANVSAGALLGFGRVATSQMIHQWLWPGIFCVGALVMHMDVHRALELIFGAFVVNMLVGLALMVHIMPRRHPHAHGVVVPPLFGLGLQLFTSEIVQLAISALPPLVIGRFASTVDVGRYALAWRIVLMLNLLVSAMGAVASPQFARAAARDDRETLRRVSSQTVGLTTALSFLPALLLAINPAFFLARFGPGYAGAAPVLRCLLIGQIALVFCAGVPELLGMSGHAKALLKVNMISATVLLVGLVTLTPRFADFGAALATAAAMCINAVGFTLAARRDLGLVPLLNFFHDLRGMVRSALKPA